MFYLREPIAISKGESINGKIAVKPNDKVRRTVNEKEGRAKKATDSVPYPKKKNRGQQSDARRNTYR